MNNQSNFESTCNKSLTLEEQMLMDEIMKKSLHPFAFIMELCTKLKYTAPTVNITEYTKPTSQFKTKITLMNGIYGEEFGATKKKSKSKIC
jgi:hypothetical protein